MTARYLQFPIVCAAAIVGCSGAAFGQTFIDRATYADRLEAMWLAQCIANWTGLRGEGQRNQPPFPTDADWGTNLGRGVLEYVFQDPWGADDDTDIEYVWLHLMHHHGTSLLTPEQISNGWIEHVNRFIWVSNANARALMDRGVVPPGTGLAAANNFWLHIDAQLTTEIFGSIAPGMPGTALLLADLPIRNTAAGHAAHASQFFVVLYALAPVIPENLSRPEQVEWLVVQARRFIPDTSKAADIIDFILADYRANPDLDDWERTRDLAYERYQLHAAANGFRYRGWTESSINLASGVLCLLYGQGDLARTIRIGTLCGWDADNPTATMGGLLGLMLGTDAVQSAFPDASLSERYWISRTRDALPDYLPDDLSAEDTFSLMADRTLPLIDDAVRRGGGVVDVASDGWLVPPLPHDSLARNPLARLDARSQTLAVLRAGGMVTAASSVTSLAPSGRGVRQPSYFASGFHLNFSGTDVLVDGDRRYYSTEGATLAPGIPISLTVTFDRDVVAGCIRLIEGDHFDPPVSGGWFETLDIELLIDGVWTMISGVSPSDGFRPDRPFQTIDWVLDDPVICRSVRLTGLPGGSGRFVTASAIDVLAPAIPIGQGYDLNGDGLVDIEDLYSWHRNPVDLTGDGVIDDHDKEVLEQAVRWKELQDMTGRRRQ
ncbi:MAG: ADP-ribosylglycohydrolase family protein [Phycisphaeraceae bacterium]|nr:ADP-ribosylglycohydrolase family protein [Phycisphaeraceae bacterium]